MGGDPVSNIIRLLIVDSDPVVQETLRFGLAEAGYRCTVVGDGLAAANQLEINTFDLVLLETALPSLDGFELLDYARQIKAPCIIISSRAEVADRVRGLRAGADDFIAKPFAMQEVLARVEAVLRRCSSISSETEPLVLSYDEFVINTRSHRLLRDGERVELTPKEFDFFVMLVKNRGHVLYRDQLYQSLWDMEYDGTTRTLDLHAQRIRRKLDLGDRLTAVYGVGYRLE